MDSPEERLRYARAQAGFKRPIDAVRRYGWKKATYYCHENGTRGLTRHTAKDYAKRFKVSIDWLLTGKGEPRDPDLQTIIDNYQRLPASLRRNLREISDSFRSSVEQ